METRGDFIIRGLWEIQTDAIINVIFGDSDTDTYKKEATGKLLARWEKESRYKDGNKWHEQGIFSTFVLLVDGMLGKENLVVLTNLRRLM